MYNHDEAVASIAASVKYFHARQKKFRIYKGGATNSTRDSQYRPDNTVDTSSLNHVLKVSPATKTIVVEPNVPMDALVAATLPHGLLPAVVMEFKGITAGGGFSGTGGESSSFKFGFFDRIVKSVEMVLANGDVVRASETELPDLFKGAASSCGTLGITTSLEIELRDAQPYVELTYFPVKSMTDAVSRIKLATSDQGVDFVDGILFSKTSGVICVGKLTSEVCKGIKVQRFSNPWDPWFYIHAEKVYKANKQPYTEAIPVSDYLFRYDRGAFWTGKYAFEYFKTPFNMVTRCILNMFMNTRVLFHALHVSGHNKLLIIQDVSVPFAKASIFLDWLDTNFGHYPLWLCPLLETPGSPMSPRSLSAESEGDSRMILNFGVWGPGPIGTQPFIQANRDLERIVRDLDGSKWLYAQAYYTEDEFWSMYDKKQYDALRDKYSAGYLPSVYDKVKVDLLAHDQVTDNSWRGRIRALCWDVWPFNGLYALVHATFRSDYLMRKQPSAEQSGKTE